MSAPTFRTADDKHRFWMVYLTKGGNPTKRHLSLTEAAEEATRLSIKTGRVAHVLECIGAVMPPDYESTKK